VLQTHHGKCSAGGRSSPGPADGPELQPGPSVAEPGHHTLSSLQGQGQCHPHAALTVELPPPWHHSEGREGTVPSALLSEPPPEAQHPAPAPAQGRGAVGEGTEEDMGTSEDAAPLLWGQVRAEGVQLGEGEALGRLYSGPSA